MRERVWGVSGFGCGFVEANLGCVLRCGGRRVDVGCAKINLKLVAFSNNKLNVFSGKVFQWV